MPDKEPSSDEISSKPNGTPKPNADVCADVSEESEVSTSGSVGSSSSLQPNALQNSIVSEEGMTMEARLQSLFVEELAEDDPTEPISIEKGDPSETASRVLQSRKRLGYDLNSESATIEVEDEDNTKAKSETVTGHQAHNVEDPLQVTQCMMENDGETRRVSGEINQNSVVTANVEAEQKEEAHGRAKCPEVLEELFLIDILKEDKTLGQKRGKNKIVPRIWNQIPKVLKRSIPKANGKNFEQQLRDWKLQHVGLDVKIPLAHIVGCPDCLLPMLREDFDGDLKRVEIWRIIKRRWKAISESAKESLPNDGDANYISELRKWKLQHIPNAADGATVKTPSPQPPERQSTARPVGGQKAQSHGKVWTREEHQAFLQGVEKFGTQWAEIAKIVPSRSVDQIKSHWWKHRSRMKKEEAAIQERAAIDQVSSLLRPRRSKVQPRNYAEALMIIDNQKGDDKDADELLEQNLGTKRRRSSGEKQNSDQKGFEPKATKKTATKRKAEQKKDARQSTKDTATPRQTTRPVVRSTPEELAVQLGFTADWKVFRNHTRYQLTAPTGEQFTTIKAATEFFHSLSPQLACELYVEDPPWRLEGHEWIGRRVQWTSSHKTSTGHTFEIAQEGKITGFIKKTDVDKEGNPGFVSETTGNPAELFHVVFPDDEKHPHAALLLDSKDLEESEVLERLLEEGQRFAQSASEQDADDPPWRLEGHEWIGRRVKWKSTQPTSARRTVDITQEGKITGYIKKTDLDKQGNPGYVSETTGEPADLFHVVFPDDEKHPHAALLLDFQDLEESEVLENLLEEDQKSTADVASSTSKVSQPRKKIPKRKKGTSRTKNSKKTEREIWDMVRSASIEDTKRPCSSKCCNRLVVAVWASNLKPKDEWFSCEYCLIREFGGWPKRAKPKFIWDDTWNLARRATSRQDVIRGCSNCRCKRKVVAVWTTKSHPKDEWFTCKECNLLPELPESSGKNPSLGVEESTKRIPEDPPLISLKRKRQDPPLISLKRKRPRKRHRPPPVTPSRSSDGISEDPPLISMKIKRPRKRHRLPPVTPSPSSKFPLERQRSRTSLGIQEDFYFDPNLSTPTNNQVSITDPSINVDGRQIGTRIVSPQSVADVTVERLRPIISEDGRVLATIKYRKLSVGNDKSRHSWTAPEVLLSIPKTSTTIYHPISFKLRRGGKLQVIPNMFVPDRLARVEKEVMNCGLFRQYRIQAQDEPRVHFLLHDQATDNFEEKQPGYSYANLSVKSRPLRKLPEVQLLSKEVGLRSNVARWNIGVNPVLYRGLNDSMGEHADDDQGEKVILCLVVSSPKQPRRIRIVPKARGDKAENDDECIELMLSKGDAYVMDKEMQENYFHSVPKRKDDTPEKEDAVRLCIVFRTGDDLQQLHDSGRPCEDLFRKQGPEQIFGNGIGLEEGNVYTREELFQMGAHRMQQRGISGKMESGADAIIVSGLREDGLGCDRLFQFVYAVEQRKGGKAVLTSWDKQLPIRVFRSSHYQSPFKAVSMKKRKPSSTIYRYDGLYKVVARRMPLALGRPYIFEFKRIDAGRDANKFNEFSNKYILAKYAEMGTMQIRQETYEVMSFHPNLIETVRDTLGAQDPQSRMEVTNPVPMSQIIQQVQDLNISPSAESLFDALRRTYFPIGPQNPPTRPVEGNPASLGRAIHNPATAHSQRCFGPRSAMMTAGNSPSYPHILQDPRTSHHHCPRYFRPFPLFSMVPFHLERSRIVGMIGPCNPPSYPRILEDPTTAHHSPPGCFGRLPLVSTVPWQHCDLRQNENHRFPNLRSFQPLGRHDNKAVRIEE